MYFIALVAPPGINKDVVKWKNFFKDNYGCTVALKSPAHITLIPPFWMKEESEQDLISALEEFSTGLGKFDIILKNFAAFKPRVIYIDVIPNTMLTALHTGLHQFLVKKVRFPVKSEERTFHPHVTLATRDLRKKAFYEAWQIFSKKRYEADWFVDGISLLRHNKKNWDVIFTSQPED